MGGFEGCRVGWGWDVVGLLVAVVGCGLLNIEYTIHDWEAAREF